MTETRIYHTITITVENWIPHNPGNETHLRSMLESYLRGKGIQTKQVIQDGKALHPVVFNIGL